MNAAAFFLLLSLATGFFVMAEPAPTDLAFLVAFGLVLLSMQFCLPQAVHTYCVLSFAFLLTNTTSGAFCTHLTHCVRYMAITVYLMLIPVLMAHFVAALGPNYLERMYKAFFLSVLISAVVGLLARAGLMPGPTTFYFREDEGLRLSPFFKDPNVYAPYLAAGLMLILGHVVASTGRLVAGLLGLAVVWLPLLLAFSRAAWLAIAASTLVYLVIMISLGHGMRANRRLMTVIVMALVFILPTTLLTLMFSDLTDFFEHRLQLQSYDANRFEKHAEAVTIALENPFGIGPGHFVGPSSLPGSRFDLAAHNVYAKIWVENGFLGLFFFLAITLWILRDLFRVARYRSPRFPIHVALIAAIVGLMVNGYVIDSLHWRHLFIILGFAIAEVHVFDLTRARTAAAVRAPASRRAGLPPQAERSGPLLD